jgi:TatD DNase family protein
MRLPFDAHNHIHLGPSPPGAAFLKSRGGTTSADDGPSVALSGMAIMATHPQDFEAVTGLSNSLPDLYPGVRVIPCYGVHPWFLHELDDSHWALNESDVPMWLAEIESLVKDNPEATVGEIGLDGFHFRPDTGDLTSSLDKQVEAFELQMDLAARLQRPVSVHTVQCFGHLMESLSRLKKSINGLPPKIYFHAFGGKIGTVDQIVAICSKGKGKALKVYFGFAPLCNFRSPKTSEVIRKVGIDRLVLESDHEDSTLVAEDMEHGVSLIAEALDETEEAIVERTTVNAFELYGLHD